MALLDAVGEPLPAARDIPVLKDFDWSAHGVDQLYSIFMTGRCGSTWLTSLLQETNLAGNPGEFFNAHVAKRECVGAPGLHGYLSALAKKHATRGRFGFEIDAARLRGIEALIDWKTVFPVLSTKCIFLYRSNLPAQAWSWVSAKKTGLWHVRIGAKAASSSVSEALPTTTELVAEMVRIRRDEEYLEKFFERHGYQPYYLDYESLLTEVDSEVRALLRILSVESEDASTVQIRAEGKSVAKIQYTEKGRAMAGFNSEHASALSMLRRNRFQINAEQLNEMFSR